MVLADTKKARQHSDYATFRCEDYRYKFDIIEIVLNMRKLLEETA